MELFGLGARLQLLVRLKRHQVLLQRELALGLDRCLRNVTYLYRLNLLKLAGWNSEAIPGHVRSFLSQALLIEQLHHLIVRGFVKEARGRRTERVLAARQVQAEWWLLRGCRSICPQRPRPLLETLLDLPLFGRRRSVVSLRLLAHARAKAYGAR